MRTNKNSKSVFYEDIEGPRIFLFLMRLKSEFKA